MKRFRVAAMAAIVLMGTGTAATAATAAASPDSIVIPPQQERYAQLGVLWWKWALAIPAAESPLTDPTGAFCAVGQNGGTWYLAGTTGGTATRSCTIPAGKRIFFPVVNTEFDYPCPANLFPGFQPAPGQTLKDFLTYGNSAYPGGAVGFIDQATNLQATLDGANIPILSSYRGTSNMFSFAGDPSLTATVDPCITGSQQKAVSDGYWLMLAPLSPGQHTLQFGATQGTNPEGATYNLTVQ
jgi:hypothetical protein